jgi:S-adenosylmethionine decarboxylase
VTSDSQSLPLSSAPAMTHLIRHVVIEAHDCPFAPLDDYALSETLLHDIAAILRTDVMARTGYKFEPQGITSVFVVGASHLSVHTWPEHGFATVDLVVCTDDFQVPDVLEVVKQRFQAGSVTYLEFRRGLVKA